MQTVFDALVAADQVQQAGASQDRAAGTARGLVVRWHSRALGLPQPEPGLVVGRKLGPGRDRVGAPDQGHQQRARKHDPRIRERGQFVGEGAQGLQEGGNVEGDGESMRVATCSVRFAYTPWDAGGPFCCAPNGCGLAADMNLRYRLELIGRLICAAPEHRSWVPRGTPSSPDPTARRDFSVVLSEANRMRLLPYAKDNLIQPTTTGPPPTVAGSAIGPCHGYRGLTSNTIAVTCKGPQPR